MHLLLQADPEPWDRARRLVSAAGHAVASIPQVVDTEQPRQALRETLLQVAHDLVAGADGAELRTPRSAKGRRRIVTAADAYLRVNKGSIDRALLVKVIKDPKVQFKVSPQNTLGLAQFLFEVGAIKKKPVSWKDYFFEHPALASGS